jgi:asparagine synthase (glutamine-hydrolysing)
MCGIAGALAIGEGAHDPSAVIEGMTNALVHRGPDAGASWIDREARVALGHRRLSIIDVSPGGAQPMVSADGRYVIVYNGELYNTEDMRAAITDPPSWRGHSDTEVLLETIARMGLRSALEAANGMFALAVWDRRDRVLSLARDRLGIKPLYGASVRGAILFASELKAITSHPGFARVIDRGSVAAFMRLNYIPAPWTIWRDAWKVRPGEMVGIAADGTTRRELYWSAAEVWCRAAAAPVERSMEDAERDLDALIGDAVRRQMVSDVPLGAFLSGGVDSSLVVAHMQRAAGGRVRTFTIGNADARFDEADHAARIAAHLGTEHTALQVTSTDALEVIPRLADMYDEPFADSSAIPTFLVSRLARRHVTVALSGDGGDELFAGYDRHAWADALWRRLGGVPNVLRPAASGVIGLAGATLGGTAAPLPAPFDAVSPGDRLVRMADMLAQSSRLDTFRRLVTVWPRPAAVVPGAVEHEGELFDRALDARMPTMLDLAQQLDLVGYLPDDILTKVDRASMAVSLEARVPLLDHRLVDFAAGLPRGLRIDEGTGRGEGGKVLLKRVLRRHLPESLWKRPKQGFGIPVGSWMRGPLRAWCEALLAPDALARDGLIDAALVRQVWSAHVAGRGDYTTALWTVLMLQAWRERWG